MIQDMMEIGKSNSIKGARSFFLSGTTILMGIKKTFTCPCFYVVLGITKLI